MRYTFIIKNLRKNQKLNQSHLARLLNKTQQGYSKLENEKSGFVAEDIIKLCEFYNVSANYILGLTDEYTPLNK